MLYYSPVGILIRTCGLEISFYSKIANFPFHGHEISFYLTVTNFLFPRKKNFQSFLMKSLLLPEHEFCYSLLKNTFHVVDMEFLIVS